MPLIEQAVELLQRAHAERSAGPEPEPVRKPTGQLIQHREGSSASDASAAVIAVPCRSDRAVRNFIPALRAGGLLAPEGEDRKLAAEYRKIKQPLLSAMMAGDRPRLGNVVVVTSALPGDGKSFTAVNLALSLALERDREVVLVDGDVAKPNVTHVLGMDGEPGLLDLVAAGCKLEEAIVKTDHPALYVLPSGKQSGEATEILRSERMASMIKLLASEPKRIALIDSPPLLATSEAGVLTSLAGQVVLVVRAAHTPQEAVLHAIEAISDDIPVSLVLNQVDAVSAHRSGYYGQYGYGTAVGGTVDVASGSDPN